MKRSCLHQRGGGSQAKREWLQVGAVIAKWRSPFPWRKTDDRDPGVEDSPVEADKDARGQGETKPRAAEPETA